MSIFDTKFELIFLLKEDSVVEKKLPTLILRVIKEPLSIKDNLINKMQPSQYYSNNGAAFILTEDNNELFFKQEWPLYYTFKPEVLIENQSEFASLLTEFKNLELLTLPEVGKELNQYQHISIADYGIWLTNTNEKHKEISIRYDAKEDNISIKSNTTYTTFFIEQLLKTKIPKFELPDEYISYIEKSNDKTDVMFIDDLMRRRKETLQITQTDEKKLKLTRKPKCF